MAATIVLMIYVLFVYAVWSGFGFWTWPLIHRGTGRLEHLYAQQKQATSPLTSIAFFVHSVLFFTNHASWSICVGRSYRHRKQRLGVRQRGSSACDLSPLLVAWNELFQQKTMRIIIGTRPFSNKLNGAWQTKILHCARHPCLYSSTNGFGLSFDDRLRVRGSVFFSSGVIVTPVLR